MKLAARTAAASMRRRLQTLGEELADAARAAAGRTFADALAAVRAREAGGGPDEFPGLPLAALLPGIRARLRAAAATAVARALSRLGR